MPARCAGVQHGDGIGLAQREGLFTIDMFAGGGGGFDLRAVLGMRGRQDHSLDGLVREHIVKRGADRELMFGSEIADRIGFERDCPRKIERRAEIARRLHQGFAPPAEADDCGIDHTEAGAPGCFIGWARAKASMAEIVSTIRFTVG